MFAGPGGGDNTCRALVTSRIYLGDHQRLLTEIGDGQTMTVKVPAGDRRRGGRIGLPVLGRRGLSCLPGFRGRGTGAQPRKSEQGMEEVMKSIGSLGLVASPQRLLQPGPPAHRSSN